MQYKVFGCKVNKYYTDRWLNSEYLRDKSGTFVASCVVTDSAKRKWIRFVKKELEHISENEKIYISGCGAFKDGKAQSDFFQLYPELADAQNKIEILDEAPDESKKIKESDKSSWGNTEESSEWTKHNTQHIDSPVTLPSQWHKNSIDLSRLKQAQQKQIYTKKFILIQWGCDSFCTFCLTVQKRGRHYYRSAEDIVEEIQDFESQGGKEIVLTGVNLSAWGLQNTHNIENFSSDIIKNHQQGGNKSRFAELLQYILSNTSIPRIRISSLGPEFITDEVISLLSKERIYPHFHFSIQSWSNNILKSMARHYDGIYMRKLLDKIQNIKREDEVDISIGADIIVWFPGETDKDFEDTYNLVKDYRITKLHAFPFSAHTMGESVPAGKFQDQVSQPIKKERMNKLMELGEKNRNNFIHSQIGKPLKVLIEKKSWDSFSGWSENYIECSEENFEIIAGERKRNGIVIGKIIQ